MSVEELMVKFNLSKKDSKKLLSILNKIDRYVNIDKKMDYVEEIMFSFVFENSTETEVDAIEEFVKDYVI